jgi:hypothetical protein
MIGIKMNTLLALALAITISTPVIKAAQAADSAKSTAKSTESFAEIAKNLPKSWASEVVPLDKVLTRVFEKMQKRSHVILALGAHPREASHFEFSKFKDPWVIYLTEPLNTTTGRMDLIEEYANQMEEGNFIVGDFKSIDFLEKISAKLSNCFDLIVTDAEVGKFMEFTPKHCTYFLKMLKDNSSSEMVLDYYVGDYGKEWQSKIRINNKNENLSNTLSRLLEIDEKHYKNPRDQLLKHDHGTKRIQIGYNNSYVVIPKDSLEELDKIYMDYFNEWKSHHLPDINLWWERNKLYPYWRRDLQDQESIGRYERFNILWPSNFLVLKKRNPSVEAAIKIQAAVRKRQARLQVAVEKKETAAIKIQSVARGKQDRKALAKRLPELEARLHKNSARIRKEVALLKSETNTKLSAMKAEEALLEKRLAEIRTEKKTLEEELSLAEAKEDYVKKGLERAQRKVVEAATEDLKKMEIEKNDNDEGFIQATKKSEDILENFTTNDDKIKHALGDNIVVADDQDPAQVFIEDIINRLELNDSQWKANWPEGLMRALVNAFKNNRLRQEIKTLPKLTKELQVQAWLKIKDAMQEADVKMEALSQLLKYDEKKIRNTLTTILEYDLFTNSETDSEKAIKIFLDGLNSIEDILENFTTDEDKIKHALGYNIVVADDQDPAQVFIEDIINRLELNDNQWKANRPEGLMKALVNAFKNNRLKQEIKTLPKLTKELQVQAWLKIKEAMQEAGVNTTTLSDLLKYDEKKIRNAVTTILENDLFIDSEKAMLKIFLDGLNSIEERL